ncbi:MAG: 23S rRNA (uracil(1939)-C(5))-methyltransferase RlmD [Lachnospiraceae bacterium]|nr:23S rRNA (uracil(1939)-C(5))-methyltransferase RlmD [Lachnospiraceae bacterium]
MDRPFSYRNKTALPVGGSSEEPALGFFAPRSHNLIPVVSCPNAMPPAGRIAQVFLQWMKKHHIAPYHEETHQGTVRHLVIRVNREGKAMVTTVINALSLPHLEELQRILEPIGVISLYLNINISRTNVIFSDRFQLIYGCETLMDTLCGLQFSLSPASFFQVNPFQTEKLYETALSFAHLSSGDTICDVYCGAGTITLMMARHCAHVTGIEIVPAAIENAMENARRNQITNADFLAGKAEVLLPQMVSDGLRPNVIIVDPPRKGLDPEVITAIAQASPSRLVYISCNAATLARDIALLIQHNYVLQKVQPVDMFPYTSHVETVCCLYHQRDKFISVPYEPKEAEYLEKI